VKVSYPPTENVVKLFYSYLLCEILRDDSVQEETINSDPEAGTCMQIPPGYPLGKR